MFVGGWYLSVAEARKPKYELYISTLASDSQVQG